MSSTLAERDGIGDAAEQPRGAASAGLDTMLTDATRGPLRRLLLPEEAPLGGDLDIDFLATQFKLSGGSIRNCSLSAAFQAADDGGVIEMRHLVRAVALEYGKQGRLTLEADFESYHELIRAPAGGTPRNGSS